MSGFPSGKPLFTYIFIHLTVSSKTVVFCLGIAEICPLMPLNAKIIIHIVPSAVADKEHFNHYKTPPRLPRIAAFCALFRAFKNITLFSIVCHTMQNKAK